jgi:peptidoglycan/LPS O-acetylase OafA/YrhL
MTGVFALSRIERLDAIRLVAAAIVVVGHYSLDLRPDLSFLGSGNATIANHLAGLFFNGQAAVIVFFVISGFVVHLPYATGHAMTLPEYVARRFLRIVPPAAVAAVLFVYFDLVPAANGFNATVLWSLICELVYYALYPLFLIVIRRNMLSMRGILLASLVPIVILLYLNRETLLSNTNYNSFGYATWIMGLPCWLAGCWLAEIRNVLVAPSRLKLNILRFGMCGLLCTTTIVRNLPETFLYLSSNIVLLNLCTPLIVWWLKEESISPPAMRYVNLTAALDRLGKASYSLYLSHMLAFVIMDFSARRVTEFPTFIFLVTVVCTAFYFAVERPAHALARKMGRAMRNRQLGAVAPSTS